MELPHTIGVDSLWRMKIILLTNMINDMMSCTFSWVIILLAIHHHIYVTRNDDTDEIVGFTILDYKKKNAEIVKKMYPQYNFSIGYSEGYSEG